MVKFAPDDPDYSSVRQFILETVGLVRAPDLDASHNDTGAGMLQKFANLFLADLDSYLGI